MEQLKHFIKIKRDTHCKNKKLSEMTEEEKNEDMKAYFNGGWKNYRGGRE
jgi:hypothetical protein